MKSYREVFKEDYQGSYVAPSRINIIGEHIDYCGGYVFPVAIGLKIKGYASVREDKKIGLYSANLDSYFETELDKPFDNLHEWHNYPIGLYKTLCDCGYKIDKGFNIYYDSKIPLGSGLSSSAALLVLTIYILNDLFKLKISRKKMALLTQKSEIEYNKVSCGILDQAAIALSKTKKGMLLDCNKFTYDYKELYFGNYDLVLLNTNKMRKLSESKYNERFEQSKLALSILKKHFDIDNLCELHVEQLEEVKELLKDDILFKRVRHIVTEQQRVIDLVNSCKNHDMRGIKEAINGSDFSLKNDYEVTGLHLDSITKASRESQYCLAARMTGGGFGGFGIAFVEKGHLKEFKKEVLEKYYKITGIKGDIIPVTITKGVHKLQ